MQLEDGRREHLATVPPPVQRKAPAEAAPGQDRVYNLLRAMAKPAYSGMTKQGMLAGSSPPAHGRPVARRAFGNQRPELVHQNRLNTGDTLRSGGIELMGEATVASDRSKVTVHMSPVFQTASDRPEVRLSSIPGGQ